MRRGKTGPCLDENSMLVLYQLGNNSGDDRHAGFTRRNLFWNHNFHANSPVMVLQVGTDFVKLQNNDANRQKKRMKIFSSCAEWRK
jgi:hypothetical protein